MKVKKEQIIKKSIKLFNKKGFDVTTKEITDYCSISSGSFFYHFPKKEYLPKEIFKYIKDDFESNLGKIFIGKVDLDFIDQFELIFNSIINWSIKNPDYFLFLLKFKNNKKEQCDNIIYMTLYEYINVGIKKGYLKNLDKKFLTDIAVSTLAHIIFQLKSKKEGVSPKYFVLFLDILKQNK